MNSIIGIGDALSTANVTALRNDAHSAAAKEHVKSEFESVFSSILLKQLRESLEEGMFGAEASDSYGTMFDMFMGQHLAQAGGVGISKYLDNYLDKAMPENSHPQNASPADLIAPESMRLNEVY
ncbi:MAG: rod-binding protein [Planctomycetales bacterium]|nr:rod-binding protein [Planctomycetales bacterium]